MQLLRHYTSSFKASILSGGTFCSKKITDVQHIKGGGYKCGAAEREKENVWRVWSPIYSAAPSRMLFCDDFH